MGPRLVADLRALNSVEPVYETEEAAPRPLDSADAGSRARALDRDVFRLAELACDLAAAALNLEEHPGNSRDAAEALNSSAVLLAAAARTLLWRVRAPAP